MSEEQKPVEEPLAPPPLMQEPSPSDDSERRWERDEKDEKDERSRRHRRRDRDEKEEKGQPSDPLSGVIWALILITAGIIFLFQGALRTFDWERFGGAWNWVFVAVGLILLLEVALRLLIAQFRRPVAGTLVFAFVLMAIGISGITGWNITWAVFLIAMGVALLLSGLLRGRF
jgi:cation transport ATPase